MSATFQNANEGSTNTSSGKSQPMVVCSVCLEAVAEGAERSIAKLKCGHHFHLDCIGSAFNAKERMQCPNCRQVEQGQWLYANGCFLHEDFVDDLTFEEDAEVFSAAGHLIASHVHHQQHKSKHCDNPKTVKARVGKPNSSKEVLHHAKSRRNKVPSSAEGLLKALHRNQR